MVKEHKVPNAELLEAGLELMRRAGKPLERGETKGRAMLYRTAEGRTVRIRTCNDHVLVVLADSADRGAALNIEGTDYLLIVMPEEPRSRGPVIGYLVPTEVAVHAARTTHEEWLASNPNTKGQNRTWNLWFDDDGPAKANGFAHKWAEYRLPGFIDVRRPSRTKTVLPSNSARSAANSGEEDDSPANLGRVIADARRQIASTAGVPESAVKITIDLT
jgi:hypothetical protein